MNTFITGNTYKACGETFTVTARTPNAIQVAHDGGVKTWRVYSDSSSEAVQPHGTFSVYASELSDNA